ncbi:MAG TPA: D-aminoacyl-tRNA deacylase [Thermoplasmata archaeon]|nr:D-aminoacyl-tRNA deacylase [Thermoplasmata archaeon]
MGAGATVLCSEDVGPSLPVEVVVLISGLDPVAGAVADRWGSPEVFGGHVDGAAIRRLNDRTVFVRRPGAHIHDDDVDLRLPTSIRESHPTLVFPSIHRSERNVPCLTVHPLGNPGPRAEVGGRPRTLVPTDPERMVSALRLLDERAAPLGLEATYEATHHGPAVSLPAFFIEIGYGELPQPPSEAVRALADVIPRIEVVPGDRVALGVGGGHYVPHFTDLALRRRWAFGHLLSRHALPEIDRATAVEAFAATPRAEGVVYARAEDAEHPVLAGIGPRLREQDAPDRERAGGRSSTDGDRSASGT